MKVSNKGYFNPKIVKLVSFTLISLCLLGSIVLCVMAIWNYGNRDTLWRMIATLGIVGLGTGIFATVNGMFGE
jgi:hypothetical protein